MYLRKSLLSLSVMSLLSACGSDDKKDEPIVIVPPTPPVATNYDHQINGTVLFQGNVSSAQVCVDLDMNKTCDDEEPTATSNNEGVYQIEWASQQESPDYYLLASWSSAASAANVPQPLRVNIVSGSVGQGFSNTHSASTRSVSQLFALKDHAGAINALTDIEFQRYQLMLAANKTDSEVQELRSRLAVILKSVYGVTSDDVFMMTAEESQSDVFVSTFEVQRYIFALIADLVSDPLAVDEVMSASIEQIRALIAQSQQSVLDYLATEPLELYYVINDALTAQGYIEQPISDNLMSQTDWDLVFDGLGFKDMPESRNTEDNFTLAPSHLNSVFTLNYGDESEHMFGAIITEPTGAGVPKAFSLVVNFDEEDEIPQECWNTDLNRWINPDRADSDYQPKDIEISGNVITTFYDGTEVPINIRVDKVSTHSAV
ncbi:hypothetical protein JQC92_19750 [Shewanella sp. 202IG2-18]|uniref:hypothetical protein n=1 Tax=Parashewanella hymeniacidonis TaxID=2807618 RepID=UPI001960DEFC|nr:hypothetical protein [Parashewanella hymeniacidonis]MBM7074232.1 hypothetical protein [Parashewanella hymeniacidonis]